MEKNLTSTEIKRRDKREKVKARYAELMSEGPVTRTQTMNREFGPYWFHLLSADGLTPYGVFKSRRFIVWTRQRNPKDPLYIPF